MKIIRYKVDKMRFNREIPVAQADASALVQVTGKTVLTPRLRAAIERLTDGTVKFEQNH